MGANNEFDSIVDKNCSAGYVEEDGREFKCRKVNYWSENDQKFWEHAGGHWYMTDEGHKNWSFKQEHNWHFDNTALLSLQPAASHAPEDCDGTGFCSWRIPGVDH